MKKKIMIGHTICYSPTSTLLLEFWGRTAMEMKFNGLKLYLLFICSLASNTCFVWFFRNRMTQFIVWLQLPRMKAEKMYFDRNRAMSFEEFIATNHDTMGHMTDLQEWPVPWSSYRLAN